MSTISGRWLARNYATFLIGQPRVLKGRCQPNPVGDLPIIVEPRGAIRELAAQRYFPCQQVR